MSAISRPSLEAPEFRRVPTRRKWPIRLLIVLIVSTIAFAAFARGKGYKAKLVHVARLARTGHFTLSYPTVLSCDPADRAQDVAISGVVTTRLSLPNSSLDETTLGGQAAMLVRLDNHKRISCFVTNVNGGDTLVCQPIAPLAPQTPYLFAITASLKDTQGISALPYSTVFTTGKNAGTDVRFEKRVQAHSAAAPCTAVAIGPDHKLYAGADDGRIFRYPIAADGSLGKPQVLHSLRVNENGPRLISGFCFDPSSTADHPILWVAHNHYAFQNAPDLTGKITRLSGPDLEFARDMVIHLPRSIRDHLTNQPSFGPDGALYIPQGSNSAMGAADLDWGNRDEHLLSAAILRLDPTKLGTEPLDALTSDVGGKYDPDAPGAPLTIYATGIRNAYDLVWHSNGHLYVPVNGSSCGGNTPEGGGAPALNNIPFNETDWLFKITPGKYYGHPNPTQKHFVLNGGNPAAGHHYADVPQYPVGTQPDPAWEPAIYDFGQHISADGIIEYLGDAFGGKLNHCLIVCRYNLGDDLIVLKLDEQGNVASSRIGITGFTGFQNPLDLTEDLATGNLYVTDYGAQKIVLLRPTLPSVAAAH